MPRRLSKPRHLLLTLSLLLSLTSATLWLRSLWFRTNLAWVEIAADPLAAYDSTDIELNNGLLLICTARYGVPRHRAASRFHLSDLSFAADNEEESRVRWRWTSAPLGWSFAAFGHYASRNKTGSIHFATTTIPLYFPTLLFALPPAIALRKYLRRHCTRNNLCLSCGYDLRASPEQCPECGAACRSAPSTFSVRR